MMAVVKSLCIKTIDLTVLFPPVKYTNSIVTLGLTCVSMDRYKTKWNKAVLDSVFEIDGKTFRMPVEWTV